MNTIIAHARRKTACAHPFKRVTREASHLYKLGVGGYFQVGKFNNTISCRDCKAVLYTETEAPPVCQKCLSPMSMVGESNGIPTCGSVLTDALLLGKNLPEERAQQRARLDLYWDWLCAREKREEKLRKGTSNEMSLGESMTRGGVRILRRGVIKQIFPYTCISSNCERQGRLVWLHTPGD